MRLIPGLNAQLGNNGDAGGSEGKGNGEGNDNANEYQQD
jgi:hypothetical protein